MTTLVRHLFIAVVFAATLSASDAFVSGNTAVGAQHQTWEYKVVRMPGGYLSPEQANKHGAQDWHLIAVYDGKLFFGRPKR